MKKPNPAEQRAIDHYIKHGIKVDAYSHAYNVTNQSKSCTYRNALRLFARPHVIAAINEAQSRQADKFDMDIYQIKKMLADAASMGLEKKVDQIGNSIPISISGAVAALSEINRMNGNHAPTKSEHSVTPINISIDKKSYAKIREEMIKTDDI